MSDRRTTHTWLLTTVLFLFLAGGSALFVRQHWQEAMNEARNNAARELGLLASLVKEELQNGNYQLAGQILKDWGAGQPNVAALHLVAANDISIGEYQRAVPATESLTLEAPIQYAYTGQARLILSQDLAVAREHRNWVIAQVGIALAVVAIMLIILTRLQLRYQRESVRLKAEIGRRKETQQALRESEQRYRIQIEHAPEGIMLFDADNGHFVEVNQNALQLFGMPREKLLACSPAELSPPVQPDGRTSPEAARQWLDEALNGGTPVFEWMHRNAAGEDIPCEMRLARMPASGRNLVRGSVTNISARKHADAMLRRDREQQIVLRQMLEDVLKGGELKETLDTCLVRVLAVSWLALLPKGGIFLMGEDGQTLQLTVSSNLSPEILSLCDRVPSGRCHCGVAAVSREMQFSNCVDHRHEISYPGMIEHGHYNLPLLSEGEVLGVMVLYLPHGFERDPAKEEFLRSVADVLAGFIRRKQAEGDMHRSNAVISAVNNAQSQFIAKHSAREIFSNLLSAILELTESEYGFIGEARHTEDGHPYIKAHGITNIAWNEETRRFFEENAPTGLDFFKLDNLFGKVVTQRQLIIANDPVHDPRSTGIPKGHPPLQSFMGIPFFEDDKVLGMIALANRREGYDEGLLPLLQPLMTAIKNIIGSLRVEQQRVAAETALQQINEELEYRVEQRTTELVLARDEAERASRAKSEFLSRMSHELRTPLNAILGFGQLLELEIREEEQADNVQEILHAGRHLLDLINEVLDLARIEAGRLTISQEPVPLMSLIEDCLVMLRPLAEARGIRIVEGGRDCGEHVLADRVRLKQVLLNLLSNAVKYNRERGNISIVCLPGDDAIQVRISDSGDGLTPAQQARLFVAFERLDADQSAIEGTGIGLALSKRLMELMGGEIGVESKPGQGSTFWVRLPAADGHAEPAQAAAGDATPDSPRSVSHPRRDVLCIEDNPANLRLIERILARRDDIRLLTASAPGLGMELAAAHRPALILLDINLPDMDGYEVMQCLRENPATRDIPVVAISANAMPADLARGKAAGFAEYLTKPVDVDRLLQVVDGIASQQEP